MTTDVAKPEIMQDEIAKGKPKNMKLNKVTIESHLNFNVNIFKKWIKQKLITDEKLCDYKDTKSIPKLSGSHIALTAMNEELCKIILEKTIERLKKDKTGLYIITFKELYDVIQVEPELRKNLYQYVDMYDNTLNYKDQYCISEKFIKKYIDDTFNKSIDIRNDAFNLLNYILLKTCVRIIDSAYIVIKAMKRKTIGTKIIISCVSIHFSGTIHNLIQMKIDETIKLYGNYIKEKEKNDDIEEQPIINEVEKKPEQKQEDEEQDDAETDEEPIVEVKKKVEPVKKQSKTNSKKVTKKK